MWNDRWRDRCAIAQQSCFDPVTLTVASIGATAAGGAISAAGTLAGGAAAKQAGEMQQTEANYQADQQTQNAGQAIAAGQRQSFDTALKTKLAVSSARANAAGNGVNAGVGSPVEAVNQLEKRGSYAATMDMFNGESTSTGLLNQAAGERYSGQAAEIGGEEAQEASYYSAAGTLASSAGSMMKTYGAYKYPAAPKSGN